MKILFFDTETTGVPKNYSASYTEVDNWPRVIQLAWILMTIEGDFIAQWCGLIQPDGWEVPKQDFWIRNGHSQERNIAEGVAIKDVLEEFMKAKQEADILCCHNLNFDHRIMWAEFIRAGMQPRSGMHKICTMTTTTNYCQIPAANGRRGYKFPKLEELHQFLFNRGFEGAHDAMADIKATKDCFFELLKRNVITIPETLNQAV